MATPFDATGKDLIELAPEAWLGLLGVRRPPELVSVIDADVGTVTAAADKVIRVADDPPWLLHVELQTGREPTLLDRMVMYNAILRVRHRLPVVTVLLLLRQDADGTTLTGRYRLTPPVGPAWEFGYAVVRVWELSVEALLAGPLTLLPVAAAAAGPAVVTDVTARVAARLRAEADPVEAAKLRSATAILLRMRYDAMTVLGLVDRDPDIKDFFRQLNEYYVADNTRQVILRLGEKRFGPPTPAHAAALKAVKDQARLYALTERLLDVASWDELLAEEPPCPPAS